MYVCIPRMRSNTCLHGSYTTWKPGKSQEFDIKKSPGHEITRKFYENCLKTWKLLEMAQMAGLGTGIYCDVYHFNLKPHLASCSRNKKKSANDILEKVSSRP